MSTREQPYATDRADSTEFEPEVIDGVEIGEVHRLRTEGAHEGTGRSRRETWALECALSGHERAQTRRRGFTPRPQ
jgi:hypothetical protein